VGSNFNLRFTVNKNELIAAVAAKSGQTKASAEASVNAVFETISKSLKKGDEVRLVGFGTFTVTKRQPFTGRNPRTGAPIKIPAANRPKFTPGKALKETVN
jgi:DNA-binding protein HU-beta